MAPKLLGIVGGVAALGFILILPSLFHTSPADSIRPINVGPTAEQIAQKRAKQRTERRAEVRARRARRQTIRARLPELPVRRQEVAKAVPMPAPVSAPAPAPPAPVEDDDGEEGD
jgi:hypothetical protein